LIDASVRHLAPPTAPFVAFKHRIGRQNVDHPLARVEPRRPAGNIVPITRREGRLAAPAAFTIGVAVVAPRGDADANEKASLAKNWFVVTAAGFRRPRSENVLAPAVWLASTVTVPP
jgi:hypothetical protein